MSETGPEAPRITPEDVQAAQDVSLFFPPVADIRAVLFLALPAALSVIIAALAWANGWQLLTWIATITATVCGLASWVFFIRAATSETKEPGHLPAYYAGWSVPVRFQPEIRWQAIKLTIRSILGLAIIAITMTGVAIAVEGIETAYDIWLETGPMILGVTIVSSFFSIPPLALLLSRYGLQKSGRRERDGGLPKSLIRRREAAIKALRRKWPDAVPQEA